MPAFFRTRGIVLHKLRYSESSLIIKVYTEALGLQSYIMRGISGKKSVGKMAQFEPLALLDLVVYNRTGRNLQYIKEVQSIHPYSVIPFEQVRNAILLFVNEILYKVIREEESNPPLFHYLWDMLIRLDTEDIVVRDFPLFFIVRLMPFIGLTPLDNEGPGNTCFSIVEGSFFSQDVPDPSLLTPQLSHWLATLLRVPSAKFVMEDIPGPVRKELLQALLDYFRVHLSGIGEFKSHQVLSKVLAG